MAEDLIRYDILAQDALRGVIRKVLSEVVKTGLPGDHHFYIKFLTRAPGVRLTEALLARYPEDMTVVLQHRFWDLKVTEAGFEVTLYFQGQPETLGVPFTAVQAFYDPSVPFRLEFDPAAAEAVPAPAAPPSLPAPETPSPEDPVPAGEKIVSLDAFRKKP